MMEADTEASTTLANLLAAIASGADGSTATTVSTTTTTATTIPSLMQDGNKLAASILAAVANTNLTANNHLTVTTMSSSLQTISEEEELKLLNFPSIREDLTTAIPLTVIFALLLVTGCIGNLCTAIVIARPKNKYMHTATNYYLFSLAMSDFLFLILGLPQEMYTLWQRYPYAFGESFCIIRGYLSEASTYASILTISAFTVERYVAICHPLWAHTMSQLPRAITSIVIIWMLAAICAIPPAAELGIITQRGPITNRTLEQSAQCATKRTLYENMFVVSAIVFFIVPMIIVTVLYILIAIELRRSSKMNSAISKQQTSSSHSQSSSGNHRYLKTASNSNILVAARQCLCNCHHHHQRGNCQASSNNRLIKLANSFGWSQSHQQLSAPSHADSRPELSQVSGQHNNNSAEQQNNHQPNKLQASSANLMAQRPSSAFGSLTCHSSSSSNNRPTFGQIAKHFTFWPSVLWPTSGATPRECPHSATCCCAASRAAHLMQPKLSSMGDVSLEAASETGTVIQATQFTGNGRQLHHQQQPTISLAETTTTASQRGGGHSPLSYHESLIQRQLKCCPSQSHYSLASATPSNTNNLNNNDVVNRLRPIVSHQMSLSQSPSRQSTSSQLVATNYCPHYHQHLAAAAAAKSAAYQQHQNQAVRRSRSAASSKKSVVRMLVAVVVSFFICWVPFHAQRLLASYLVKDENQNQVLLDIYLKLTYISGVMYYLSSTINPLLYQLMSAKFRLAFKETFNCSLLRCAIFGTSKHQQHSPTNSLKDTNNNNHHHHSNNNHNHTNKRIARSQLTNPTSRGAPSVSGPAEICGGAIYSEPCGSQCQCGFPAMPSDLRAHPYFGRAPPLGVIARLKGRLNSSLGSLLQASRRDNSLDSNPQKVCDCCPLAGNGAVPQVITTSSLDNQQPASNGTGSQQQRKLSSCASTPLLAAELQATSGSADQRCQSATGNPPPSPTFQAHSMLKFIRSPTSNSCVSGGQQQQLVSLTRLSSRDEDDFSANTSANELNLSGGGGGVGGQHDRLLDPMSKLIRPTTTTGSVGQHSSPLTSTSGESGNSTGSSPDQSSTNNNCNNNNNSGSGAVRAHQHPKLGSTGSGSSGGAAENNQLGLRRVNSGSGRNKRRRSLQQMHNLYSAIKGGQPPTHQRDHHPNNIDEQTLAGQAGNGQAERRKSSASSVVNHQQRCQTMCSSSLSSSERQLDKKLSLSTTTSAIEDYGSYTTTNSLLTGELVGSNSNLSGAFEDHQIVGDMRTRQSSCASGAANIEDDPTTVIPMNGAVNEDLGSILEVKRKLMAERESKSPCNVDANSEEQDQINVPLLATNDSRAT